MQEEQRKKFEQAAEKFLIGMRADSDVVIKKLKELNDLNREETVFLLNYFAGIEKNPQTLLYIVKEIGKHRDKSSTRILIDLLTGLTEQKDQYLKIRCTAANILGNIKDEIAVVPLMYVMNNREENYRLRLGAAEALGKIGNNQAVMPLIGIVSDEEEKSIYLKESATKALGMLGDERAVEPLINILDVQRDIIDKFTYLKEKTVEALGRLNFKKDRRIEALKNVLNDKSPHVRASAIEALADTEEEIVIEFIEPMIYDDNECVAKTAVHAIYTLQDKEYLIRLLNKEDLPPVCREEIQEILAEEEELEEELDEEPAE